MTIDAVRKFHNELLGIAKLGIPLNLGFDRPVQDLAKVLDEILASIQGKVGGDQAIFQSIEKIPQLSTAYRSALATWLETDGSPIALESLVAPAAERQQSHRLWNLSLQQPLLILAIGYLVMIYICSVTTPKLEAIYEQTGHLPNFASSIMIALRKARIVWIPALPILFASTLFYCRTMRSQSKPTQATMQGGLQRQGHALDAVAAEQLAELLKCDVALSRALELIENDFPDALVSTSGLSLRPMMQWAISEKSDPDRIRSLQWVAATYRNFAYVQREKIRNWLPPIAMGVFGGCVVLGVALSVFWPIAELLIDLAKPEATR